jgi:hypothetical protein
MGGQGAIDFDGDRLDNVLGRVATDVVMGRRTPQQGLDTLRTIRDRLPVDGGAARRALSDAIRAMDGNAPLPVLPDGTPEPLRRLAADLHSVPICRGRWSDDLDKVRDIAEGVVSGRLRSFQLDREIDGLHNGHHESYGDAGKTFVDEAVLRTRGELAEWERQRRAAARAQAA